MISLPFSLSKLEYYLYHWLYFPSHFPHPYSLLSLLALFAIGLALMFKGHYSWNIIFGALGAYFGFIMGHYVTTLVSVQPFPDIIVYIVGAVVGAILLIYLVRVFLSLGISYLSYLAVVTILPGQPASGAIVFLSVLIVSILLYHKIVIGIAGVIGAFATWFVLMNLGIASFTAELIAAIMLILGLFLQYNQKAASRKKKGNIQPFGQDSQWNEE